MTDRLENFRAAYFVLQERVQVALRIQIGDLARLNHQRDEVLSFAQSAQQHSDVFPPHEYATLQDSVNRMVVALEDAGFQSLDPPDGAPLAVTWKNRTGRRGRPRIEIDAQFLASASQIRGPTDLATSLPCGSRTVRRRQLEQGVREHGVRVYEDVVAEDGQIARTWTSANAALPRDQVSDEQLDQLMHGILQMFPNFGRSLIQGSLRSQGIFVPRARIRESFVRVHGPPPNFGDRHITRRIYNVAGTNSLWHHDGYHALIRWKFVIHAFIDGFSRFLTGVQVSGNNRGATVLALFLGIVLLHGWPSRLRGDHGVENIAVAKEMLRQKGPGRGSYIWGRSVHNTRIERTWLDLTLGLGNKWHEFFMLLETFYGLNHNNPAHIWLLHHLFLEPLNREISAWAQAWNSHVIQHRRSERRGQKNRSPADMFLFGMLERGPRGLHSVASHNPTPVEPTEDELASYGVDWEEHQRADVMDHLLQRDPQEWEDDNPFQLVSTPSTLNEVICEAPNCPLSAEQVHLLDAQLDELFDMSTSDMAMRRTIWQRSLSICSNFFQ